jgi:cytochrome b pre-mRNA-processing protein 3
VTEIHNEKLLKTAAWPPSTGIRLAGRGSRSQYAGSATSRKPPANASKEKHMTFLARIFGGRQERESYRPLYDAIVNASRDPDWYVGGQVPDTIDGRFDMLAAVMALTLLRLEKDGEPTRTPSVLLTEIFISDMDGSVRQIGIGDLMVGKQVGKMMGALGGRLAVFRSEIETGGDFTASVAKNIFHDAAPNAEAVDYVSSGLRDLHAGLQALSSEDILKGRFPA